MLGIKRTSGPVAFVGPQSHAVIPGGLREMHACLQQTRAQAATARVGHQQKQSKFGHRFGVAHTKDAAYGLIFDLRNPPGFCIWVVILGKRVQDAAHQRAERGIEPVIRCVQALVFICQPIDISWREWTKGDV